MTLAMIIMIAVGCAIGLAGLGLAVARFVPFAKQAREAGISSMSDIHMVARKAEALGPRLAELERRQKVVAERLERLSATTSELDHLKDELDRALAPLTKLKS